MEISFFWSAAYAAFSLGIQKSVICHNVNTQNVKIARRDRPHILAFENLLLQLGQLFRDFTLKTLNDDIYQFKYIYSFYVADQDMARYSACSAQEKCVSLAEPYTTKS